MTTLSDVAAAPQFVPDIVPGRLSPEEVRRNFDEDVAPPLTAPQAAVEASRCYFCHDAPCVEACPTDIDIPGFIRAIATGNIRSAAVKILERNIMGGTCARVCPTEILCEDSCVRMTQEDKPVRIGLLQRHATDWLFERGLQPFARQAPSGKRVAVVGAGPAGLSCAHRLAMLGHKVTLFEARSKPGGLNEYGIAAYKMPGDFAQREIAFILSLGGITLEHGTLGQDVTLADLRHRFDAVFLGLGLNATNALGTEGEELDGVSDAVDFIARLRQETAKEKLPIGRKIVVIGGGNTAIDAATQARRLGAEDVTIVYRRGPQHMSATRVEQEWAQTNGVRIKHWAQPRRVIGWNGRVREVEFEYTRIDDNDRLIGTGETFTLLCDQVFKAIGQRFVPAPLASDTAEMLELTPSGRIAVNDDRETSLRGVWAGGDAIPGQDLTVQAVQDGKLAAHAIDRFLRA